MAKPKHQFDPNAAFKNIVNPTEKKEEETEINNQPLPDNKINTEEAKETKPIIVVSKPKAERKSKAVHLLLKPTIHKRAQHKCKELDISLNECINQLLAFWVDE